MKVYPGKHNKGTKERIFNYRTCRARRVVENVIGISSSVFRVLRKPLLLEPEKAVSVVMAVVHLPNFLRRNTEAKNFYNPPGSLDYEDEDGNFHPGSWRSEASTSTTLLPIRQQGRKPTNAATVIRDELADYFIKEGQVSWQNECA